VLLALTGELTGGAGSVYPALAWGLRVSTFEVVTGADGQPSIVSRPSGAVQGQRQLVDVAQ